MKLTKHYFQTAKVQFENLSIGCRSGYVFKCSAGSGSVLNWIRKTLLHIAWESRTKAVPSTTRYFSDPVTPTAPEASSSSSLVSSTLRPLAIPPRGTSAGMRGWWSSCSWSSWSSCPFCSSSLSLALRVLSVIRRKTLQDGFSGKKQERKLIFCLNLVQILQF